MDNLNFGIVGNCRSAALISEKGSIDWFCLPNFNSPSAFAHILDKKGGWFGIVPQEPFTTKQFYIPHTNILVTRFECESGIFEVNDFMPRYHQNDMGYYYAPPDLIRYIKHIEGEVKVSIEFNPQLEYALPHTRVIIENNFIKAYTSDGDYDSLYLYTSLSRKNIIKNQTVTISKDEYLLISYNQKILKQDVERAYLKFERTKVYWLNWAERTTFFKKYNEEIIRSALVLKLLSYQKSGAILAAPTTSLPETIGEVRNWDYRFCWIRDASMVVKLITRLGHYRVAQRYLKFIIDLLPDKGEKMQIMYGINGEKNLYEYELAHMEGYEGSRPVRIGNAAYIQKQNDIYGILMDVILQHFELYSTTLEHSEDLWTIVRNVVKVVEENWEKPDKGIWEIRNEDRHFTFSKVLCWVALDRAVKIARILKQNSYIVPWRAVRDLIKAEIIEQAWSEEKQAFTQAYEVEDMDASVLLMEPYGFIEASDPKYKNTVLAIQKELETDGLMFRYRNKDDFGDPKSAFTICSFWLINSLYKIGHKEEAIEKFNKILSYSNHLGLFSEDIDFKTKRLLGNFPQAYSHLAIIETAINLSGDRISEEEEVLESLL
ncbi:glycoside hydrolase family 15 protein [Marinilabiliaceae bacterium JC017]|nr:glycoside hydrolase family 15 protein [Marinilabiliaceae bacterium JC017]